MNRDQPTPIETEEGRTAPRASVADENLAREQAPTRSDDGHDGPVEEPRMVEEPGMNEVRTGDEGERGVKQDRTHVEGMSPSELSGYHERFADLQTRFIADPKGATNQAGSLLKEAVDRLMESMGEGGDTERMRLGMQRYRQALETIVDQTAVQTRSHPSS